MFNVCKMSGPQLTERDESEEDRALKSGAQTVKEAIIVLKNKKKAYNVEETREYMRKKKEEFKEAKLKIEAEKRKAIEEKKKI